MSRAPAPLAAVGRALHLIGIAEETLAGRRMRVEGERITVTRFEKIALVLRSVDAAQWEPKPLELMRADSAWVAREAWLHEAILGRAMAQATVVPVRPFTVFSGARDLDGGARSHYARWRRSLGRIAGKTEWTLHVYRGPHDIPAKRPYLLRTLLARPLDEQPVAPIARPIGSHLVAVWRACSGLATAARRIEVLADAQQIFSASFLLQSARVDPLHATLDRFLPQARELGLSYYLEGPRPAFNFV